MAAATKKSARATVRKNTTKNLWTASIKPLDYGRTQFRFWLDRSDRQLPNLNIDPWVETVDWVRSGPSRTGELNFRRPLGAHPTAMIASGDIVVCDWDQFGTNGPWRSYWRMKISTPQHEIEEGIVTLALASSLASLSKSKVAWKFRKDKTHPHGWTAQQITVAVCRRFHVPLWKVPTASYLNERMVLKSESPIDVITRAWGLERKHTGRRYDVDTSAGGVQVTEFAEPRFLLVLGADLLDATVNQSLRHIASSVVATATHKVDGHKQATKLRVKVTDAKRLARYGYVVKTLAAPAGIKSKADLRDWAKQQLAVLFRNQQSVTFTAPGIPLVDRGTPLRLYLPEADLNELVFVKGCEHDLSAGSYTMDLTVGFNDPWATNTKTATTAKKKAAAAARRGRKTPTAATAAAPASKYAATRTNG